MRFDADIIVIGGGIAGLAAAWEPNKAGRKVLLLESSDRVGGLIKTSREGDFLAECGPNSFLGSAESLLALAHETGLDPEIIETPLVAADRFIYYKCALRSLPRGPLSFIATPLLSWRGKMRLLGEMFVRRSDGGDDETVSDFVRRRLGNEALDRLIDPLVAGIFAGDPDKLSLAAAFPKMAALERDYGGLFKGALLGRKQWQSRAVRSFRHGMEALPLAIARKLGDAITTGATVETLARGDDGMFIANGRRDGTSMQWRAGKVVCATPAPITASIISSLAPEAEKPLRDIVYAPVVVVHAAYELDKCPRSFNGFGFLVPRREPVQLLGSLWTSSCFPDRAPQNMFLATCFFGGMRNPAICNETDEQIRATLARDVRATMGITAAPAHLSIIRHRAAIPQYTIGHQQRIARIASAIASVPGLYLTGNYFTGTSVNDTIAHAIATVQTFVLAHRV